MGTRSRPNFPLICSDLFRYVGILIVFYIEKTSNRNFSSKTSNIFMGSTFVVYLSETKQKEYGQIMVYMKLVNHPYRGT